MIQPRISEQARFRKSLRRYVPLDRAAQFAVEGRRPSVLKTTHELRLDILRKDHIKGVYPFTVAK